MKRLAVVCLAVSLVITFSLSCQAETLELLTWSGYAPKVLMDKFEKETGITVKPTYSNNEEIIAKLRATRGAGFDLAQPSQDRISSVQKKYRLYQPIDFARVDAGQIVPSMLAAVKKNTMVDGKSYALPHVYGTSGLIVNRKYAPDASDYKDLLNPAYAGRVSYRLKRPTLIGIAYSMQQDPFVLYANPKSYKKLMDRVGAKLIGGKGLVKNYWTNGDALLQSMRSEEVFVAMAWDNGGWKLHAENPDIDFVAPKSGALGWIDTFAIPAKAKNVDAAYQWINFMMRPENAAVFTNAEKYGTASAGAIDHYDADVKANFQRSFSQADIDNIKWYPPVPARLESIEGLILDKVKAAN
ncbi:spermidine/putrescine ABC transporter substrate-binding protein [Desulfosarcina alkanivorans]|uniref:Spermidine/putrescine ABC transporter substrate-binding protein n=1 Tax=Desulfosarcina alkanivorans TaxID=571177 RepID=A0A5K7YZR2_9BACT|nr:extracellular solute-binding protein [Desulfosarcina alkanivorans]BBO70097.1 spermidine/putrescine ABC transporter substrate-binding protein [Desulfosarcina alkanivorans]